MIQQQIAAATTVAVAAVVAARIDIERRNERRCGCVMVRRAAGWVKWWSCCGHRDNSQHMAAAGAAGTAVRNGTHACTFLRVFVCLFLCRARVSRMCFSRGICAGIRQRRASTRSSKDARSTAAATAPTSPSAHTSAAAVAPTAVAAAAAVSEPVVSAQL